MTRSEVRQIVNDVEEQVIGATHEALGTVLRELLASNIAPSLPDGTTLRGLLDHRSAPTAITNETIVCALKCHVPQMLMAGARQGLANLMAARALAQLTLEHGQLLAPAIDAVRAWATALHVDLHGPATRRFDLPLPLRTLADYRLTTAKAVGSTDWREAIKLFVDVLEIDPCHPSALREVFDLQDWRAPWMKTSGEDDFGRWASVLIAGVEHRFRWCPPGRFMMGSPQTEQGHCLNEWPQHEVELSRGFWLGESPVTRRQLRAMSPEYRSRVTEDDDKPAVQVGRYQSRRYAGSCGVGATYGFTLRIPTEAEWEYACRAGTTTMNYSGEESPRVDPTNPWGLQWMLRGVHQWCDDQPHNYNYTRYRSPQESHNSLHPLMNAVARGGGLRAAKRHLYVGDTKNYETGMRLVLVPRHLASS